MLNLGGLILKITKKILSCIVAFALSFAILPANVFASVEKASEVGMKIIQKEYDDDTKILVIAVQGYLPSSLVEYPNCFATIIGFDSKKLTLIHSTDETEYTPTDTPLPAIDSFDILLKDADNKFSYSVTDGYLCGIDDRAVLALNACTLANTAVKSEEGWFDLYTLRFKIKDENSSVNLLADSIRFADYKNQQDKNIIDKILTTNASIKASGWMQATGYDNCYFGAIIENERELGKVMTYEGTGSATFDISQEIKIDDTTDDTLVNDDEQDERFKTVVDGAEDMINSIIEKLRGFFN